MRTLLRGFVLRGKEQGLGAADQDYRKAQVQDGMLETGQTLASGVRRRVILFLHVRGVKNYSSLWSLLDEVYTIIVRPFRNLVYTAGVCIPIRLSEFCWKYPTQKYTTTNPAFITSYLALCLGNFLSLSHNDRLSLPSIAHHVTRPTYRLHGGSSQKEIGGSTATQHGEPQRKPVETLPSRDSGFSIIITFCIFVWLENIRRHRCHRSHRHTYSAITG